MRLYFSAHAIRDLKKLPLPIRKRIVTKMEHYLSQRKPYDFGEKLVHHAIGSYRFRIGDYRVIVDTQGEEMVVLRVGHRREIYR
jgi:mRNA interferase RelE/StbE